MTKEFIKELKLKKMKASEAAAIIAENQKDLIDFYIKEAHRAKNAEIVKQLHEKMFDAKFPKALNKVIKAGKKGDAEGLDCGFAVIIVGFIEKNKNDERLTEELMGEYSAIVDSLLKSRAKKIAKKVNVDSEVVKELLMITPDIGYISNDKFVGIYSQKMLRKLYLLAENQDLGLTEISQVEVLFKKLFGKKLLDLIAINILLEKKEYIGSLKEKQIAVWNLMTNFALSYINGEDKNHIIELLEYYCMRRRADANKERDGARRINLNSIDVETYGRLAKAVAKFEKNGKPSIVKYL